MSDTAVLSRVSGGAIDGRLNILRVRQRLFHSFHIALVKYRDALLEATQADDGCTRAEAQAVFAGALIELRNHYDLLDFEKDLELEYNLARSRSNEHKRTSIALVYLIPSPLNLLFNLVSVLSAALEAGSCVIIELQSTIQRTPPLLRKIITESLDQEAFGVVSSRAPAEFLARCVIVDQQPRSKNNLSAQRVLLSPEYRNIALVDRTGDTKLAAQEIVASRLMLGGASSYAVDLVIVNEFVEGEFQEALSRELEVIGSRNMSTQDHLQVRRRMGLVDDAEDTAFDRQVTSSEVTFIRGDSSEGVLQVRDRQEHPFLTQVLEGQELIADAIGAALSLDDAIDFLSTEYQQLTPIGALYLFAKAREAKYLSQYIESRATYVNHIPAQLSIGPMVPKDYSTNLRTRYKREMFELPSPEIVPGPNSHLVSHLLDKVDLFDQVAQKSLKPTGQPESGAWGFFEQGIILGATVYILPVLGAMLFGVGYAGWTGYCGWRNSR